jgi:hypothetical protein
VRLWRAEQRVFDLIDPGPLFSRNSPLFPELSGIGTCQDGDVFGRLRGSAFCPFPPFFSDNDTDDEHSIS